MAKAKNMTAAEVRVAMDKVTEARGEIYRMEEAVMRLDNIPDSHRCARDLVGLARDANQLAVRLFMLADIQDRQAKIDAMEKSK